MKAENLDITYPYRASEEVLNFFHNDFRTKFPDTYQLWVDVLTGNKDTKEDDYKLVAAIFVNYVRNIVRSSSDLGIINLYSDLHDVIRLSRNL